MDESVLFVQELRSGDEDIYVCESKRTSQDVNLNRRKCPVRKCKNSSKPIPVIDLSRDSDNFESQANKDSLNLENFEQLNIETKEIDQMTKKNSLECPVCLDPIENREPTITKCGHLFCGECINGLFRQCKPKCPKCRRFVTKGDLRRVFL